MVPAEHVQIIWPYSWFFFGFLPAWCLIILSKCPLISDPWPSAVIHNMMLLAVMVITNVLPRIHMFPEYSWHIYHLSGRETLPSVTCCLNIGCEFRLYFRSELPFRSLGVVRFFKISILWLPWLHLFNQNYNKPVISSYAHSAKGTKGSNEILPFLPVAGQGAYRSPGVVVAFQFLFHRSSPGDLWPSSLPLSIWCPV